MSNEDIVRIRPPDFSTIKKKPNTVSPLTKNPVVQRRIDFALKEFRRNLRKYNQPGPSAFYGTPRFRNSRKYVPIMGTLGRVVEHLDELRYMNMSEVPIETVIADYISSIFDYYQYKFRRCPVPQQLSPTKNTSLIFQFWIEKYDKQYGDEQAYWDRKAVNKTKGELISDAQAHRKGEVEGLRNIGPAWDDARILKDIVQRFGNHVKSIDDYIEHGGLLDEHGCRRPADWV